MNLYSLRVYIEHKGDKSHKDFFKLAPGRLLCLILPSLAVNTCFAVFHIELNFFPVDHISYIFINLTISDYSHISLSMIALVDFQLDALNSYLFIYNSFIYLVVCLTTGPKPLPL